MPRVLIERNIPGASRLTPVELSEFATAVDAVAARLGAPYTWVASFVAGDKIYCLHEVEDLRDALEHSRRAGLPADLVTEVAAELGPQRGGGEDGRNPS
ncbi:nickel-binding protein [Nocardioides sp. SYSU D00038]|uniref:nickel-binding protein n=1 Tax=Nocardioides sp. SYSU D00038 TaxID=2812554 RepID=UPI001968858C|nr:nickel-binding protein [Nocardioides sp. SYSU D00038]